MKEDGYRKMKNSPATYGSVNNLTKIDFANIHIIIKLIILNEHINEAYIY